MLYFNSNLVATLNCGVTSSALRRILRALQIAGSRGEMGSNHGEGLMVGSGNHAGRDAGVECNEPALLFDGQRQQIDTGNLL